MSRINEGDPRIEQIRQLCATNISMSRVAEQVGISAQQAYSVARRFGIFFHKRPAGRPPGSLNKRRGLEREPRRTTEIRMSATPPTGLVQHYTGVKVGLSRWA